MFISCHFNLLDMPKDKEVYFLRCNQKARTASAQSFTLWQQAIIEITRRDYSFACSRHIYLCVALCAHPFCAESHFQCNINREVATTSPPFCSEPHLSHIFFVKVAPGTTFTSWTKHYFVVIGKPRRTSMQSLTLWQQATIQIPRRAHSISACLRHIYMSVVLHVHPVRGESHIQHNTNRVVATLAERLG